MDPLQSFRAAAPTLEQWRLRQIRNPPEQPEAGSVLGLDDSVFPPFPISEAARISLLSSGEHLRLTLDGLERANLYSTAQHTALRGALVGAAQAVWILGADDRGVRRERGLQVVAHSYEQLRKYHETTWANASLIDLGEAEVAKVAAQIEWVRTREHMVATARTERAKLNVTKVIRESASIAFKDPKERVALLLDWASLSSDAHVLVWGLATRARFDSSATNKLTGLSLGIAGTDPDHLAPPFNRIFRLLKCGWSYFDRRCEA